MHFALADPEQKSVQVRTKGGSLCIDYTRSKDSFTNICLQHSANLVFKGQINHLKHVCLLNLLKSTNRILIIGFLKKDSRSDPIGWIIIYPSDTLYGLGCDITNKQAIERICRIKGIKPEKANFSFICRDFMTISTFTKPISNANYKLRKRILSELSILFFKRVIVLPKLMKNRKKQ